MVLQFEDMLIVGDSAWSSDGRLILFPGHLMPDPYGSKKEAVKKILSKIVMETGAKSLLSGHQDDLMGSLQDQL